MIEPSKLLQSVEPAWTPSHLESRLRALKRARRNRRVRQVLLVVVPATAALALFALNNDTPMKAQAPVVRRQDDPAPPGDATLPEPSERMIFLADGSQLLLDSARTELFVERMEPEAIVVRLAEGMATFDVVRNIERTFDVRSHDVTVRVLGTRFSVARLPTRTRVVVVRGRASVAWPDGERILEAGESGLFPPDENERISHQVPAPPVRNWRRLAREGRYDEAFSLLASQPEPRGVSDLMLAADAAWYSRHPLAALPHLRRVHTQYPDDPRSTLAAFTEGRILLGAGRGNEAARAFRHAQTLEPNGPLVEDALAREVEALFLAESADAPSRAAVYHRRYPNGRRVKESEPPLPDEDGSPD